MRWYEWKNLSINENQVYFRNSMVQQKEDGKYNFEGIKYDLNNLDKLPKYRVERKERKCAYLKLSIDMIKSRLEELKYSPDYDGAKSNTIDIYKNTIIENQDKLLFKKQSKNINILTSKFNKLNNNNITIVNLKYEDILESCRNYSYICLDLINTPEVLLKKIDILDFVYKCYLINCIPIFITKINMNKYFFNSVNVKIELPYICIENFEKLIAGFENKLEQNIINIGYKYINEICKTDYDLDKLVIKKVLTRNYIKQQYKDAIDKKIDNTIIDIVKDRNYFKDQYTCELEYDDILLDTKDDTNLLLIVIYYLMLYKKGTCKPRFFAYDTIETNNFLSMLEFIYQDRKIRIPIFKMNSVYISHKKFKFINIEYDKLYNNQKSFIIKDNISKIIKDIYLNIDKIEETTNILSSSTIQEFNEECIKEIKNKTNTNYIIGIHIHQYKRYKSNKLEKYCFLNEIYYILAIDKMLKDIMNKYIEEFKRKRVLKQKIELLKVHLLIFSTKEDEDVSRLILDSIIKGYKTKLRLSYSHINDYISLTSLNNIKKEDSNYNDIFMNHMNILSLCDSKISSNSLTSILADIYSKNNTINNNVLNCKLNCIPGKWLIDKEKNNELIKNFKENSNYIIV